MQEPPFPSNAAKTLADARPPGDLAEFVLRWPEFRPTATALAARETISQSERFILEWLTKLADRVGPSDLQTRPDQIPSGS